MMLTLPTDLFHHDRDGVVSGHSGTGAGLGGVLFTWATGFIVDHVSYQPIFISAAILPILALIAVQWLIPRIRLLEPEVISQKC
jgi:ACS family hexuronate transporter-like MFS transporter